MQGNSDELLKLHKRKKIKSDFNLQLTFYLCEWTRQKLSDKDTWPVIWGVTTTITNMPQSPWLSHLDITDELRERTRKSHSGKHDETLFASLLVKMIVRLVGFSDPFAFYFSASSRQENRRFFAVCSFGFLRCGPGGSYMLCLDSGNEPWSGILGIMFGSIAAKNNESVVPNVCELIAPLMKHGFSSQYGKNA